MMWPRRPTTKNSSPSLSKLNTCTPRTLLRLAPPSERMVATRAAALDFSEMTSLFIRGHQELTFKKVICPDGEG
ncbi:hypothetical protein DSECCO2_326500 [anaerobic digester metagenome]